MTSPRSRWWRARRWGARAIGVCALGLAAAVLPGTAAGQAPVAPLDLVGQIGGEVGDVEVSAGVAYAAIGPRLVALDVTVPGPPRWLGQSEVLPGRARAVAVEGDTAAVAMARAGLALVDVTQPGRPRLLGTMVTAGEAVDVALAGRLAYVATVGSGLWVVDVTDPGEPQTVARLASAPAQRAVRLAAGRAYLADALGLRVVDVSDPSAPEELGRLDLGSANDVAVEGDLAYVLVGAGEHRGLSVLNVHDARRPVQVGRLELEQTPEAIALEGTRAYLAASPGGLVVVDVAAPLAPREIGRAPMPGGCGAVAVRSGRAFIGAGSGGLGTVDTSGAAPWPPAERTILPGRLERVAVDGEILAALDRQWPTLWTFELASGRPVVTGRLEGLETANDLAVRGGRAYVAGRGLRVYDLGESGGPRLIGEAALDRPPLRAIDVAGNLAAAVRYDGRQATLVVFNVVDGARPREAGAVVVPGRGADVRLRGTLAFVAGGDADPVSIVDVGVPSLPRVIGQAPAPASTGVAVVGERLLVVGPAAGLLAFDVSDPTRPGAPVALDLGRTGRIDAFAGWSAVTGAPVGGVPGVWALRSTRGRWGATARSDTAGRAADVALFEDRLLVADGEGGLLVLSLPRSEPVPEPVAFLPYVER